MAYTKATDKAQRKWVNGNYDSIKFTAPKGFNEKLIDAAAKAGISKRQFIIQALEKEMENKK